MHTIFPTSILILIFAATVWGCGSEPLTADEGDKPPRAPTNASSEQATPTVVAVGPGSPSLSDKMLASSALPRAPKSVLHKSQEASDGIAEKGETAAGALRVGRLALSRGIESREPVDPGLFFERKDAKLFAFVEMVNVSETDQSVFVSFRHESGHTAGHVELSIPAKSPRWRTWAYSRNVQRIGQWTLVIEDEGGGVLDAVDFEVMEASESL